MLVEFKITNFRSIRDTQTLSMVSGTGAELPQNACPSGIDPDLHLVRSAVIYGPNAGGKSNLIRALSFMCGIVLFSAKESQKGEKIPVENFLFDKESRHKPSEFEVTFIAENIRYQYGFIVDKNRIYEEWLLAYPFGRPQEWFSRKYDKKTDKYEWKFSKFFKVHKQVVDLTRADVLFLSNAVKLNNKQLFPVFDWFQKGLIIIRPSTEYSYEKSIELLKTSEGKNQLMKYLNIADPSIADISLELDNFLEDKLPKEIPQTIKELIRKQMVDDEKINLIHAENVTLSLEDESDGTRKFISFAGRWIDALKCGRVMVVDELDNSLHPLAVRFLVSLINNPEANKKNAQLIFSTHDTTQLDNELFRRDQVWFVEKDKNNATQLYPLLDFSPRINEAIGKGYLQGRYGALPYVGEWRF